MDLFIVIIDLLVVISYILLTAIISPFMMRFLKNRNYDIFFQLIPVLAFIFVSSVAISIGYGGFKETLFFQITSILSLILLLALLLLTLLMKKVWPEKYEKLVAKVALFKLKEISFLKSKRQ